LSHMYFFPRLKASIFEVVKFFLYVLWFFFFCCTGVWTQGVHLEPLHQPFCNELLLRQGLTNCLPTLALTHESPDLCLLSSYDYRHEPLVAWLSCDFCVLF
jgi:hypothetical protein